MPDLPNLPRYVKQRTRVWLSADDFRDGPYRADTSDVELVLQNDIEVGWEPASRAEPFHLGFFAAIIIGAPRVSVNLNAKRIAMHPNFRKVQRFFSIVSLDVTPFPPPRLGFVTVPRDPTDITIVGPGTIGLSSHFGVHASTLTTGRILIEHVTFEEYEVGAVSISGASDVWIRHCRFGAPIVPTISSDHLMLRDLADTARKNGARREADELANLAARSRTIQSSDALCRTIVLSPFFNTSGVPTAQQIREHGRIARVAVTDSTFDSVLAEPIETIGAKFGEHGEPIKDVFGNLVAYDAIVQGSIVSRLQAAYTNTMPPAVRQKLMAGPSSAFTAVHGMDRRGHSLQAKGSSFVRVDGAAHVTLRNLTAKHVRTSGRQAASVGFMFNHCDTLSVSHVSIGGVHVSATGDSPQDALSDARPRAGLLVRNSVHVTVNGYRYSSDASCASSMNDVHDATLNRCTMNAPSTFLKCTHVRMERR